ncbi:MAG: Dynamin family protein [Desulfuromonas sp.]|nr:MAG: Dynamin family protein [Desulfuromonas sp.]
MDVVNGAETGNAQPGAGASLDDILTGVLGCLDGLDFDCSEQVQGLNSLRERLTTGQFRLAVLGQFKRGKSTLLNALLGDNLLPTDILPVTAIPTFISYAPSLSARVYYNSGAEPSDFSSANDGSLADFLNRYVTEAGNPDNLHQVDRVAIGHPAKLLQQGVVLIDTPGIGSTHRHNTEVAYQVLPQCDAALFLVSPDPPITEVELEYLKEIRRQLPRTFYLLNKIDYLNADERIASLRFLADQLTPLLEGAPQILPISARKGLEACLAGQQEGWKESGMQQVEKNLIDFLAREKQQALQESIRLRIRDQIDALCMRLELSLNALKLPEEELKQRIAAFRSSLPDVEREKLAARDVLAGDLKRIEKLLHDETADVQKRAKAQLLVPLEGFFGSIADTEELERIVRGELAQSIPRFFAPEMPRVATIIQQEATALLALHQRRSNELIERVRQNAAELFDVSYRAPSARESYTTFSVPSWNNDLFISDMDPLGQRLSRKFLTRKFRHRRTIARLREEARKLVSQNVEQISWALRRGLEESFRHFSADLAEQLEKTIAANRAAMEVALDRSANRAAETAGPELRLKQGLKCLQEQLSQLEG